MARDPWHLLLHQFLTKQRPCFKRAKQHLMQGLIRSHPRIKLLKLCVIRGNSKRPLFFYSFVQLILKVYDNKVVDSSKDPFIEATGSSSFDSLSSNLKSYLDELVGMLWMTTRLGKKGLWVELKEEIQASEAQVIAQVEYVISVFDHLGGANDMFNIGPSDIDIDPSIEDDSIIVVVPPSDEADIP
ncbi:unnamed protein product [Vicia faba]|uniref:Uncharacterized protein n=1 Tax=Vicia faba TaxID=3906 RepID=A0AAV1ASN7_VICFA|nr:unnamed protein product [Vicia faba]